MIASKSTAPSLEQRGQHGRWTESPNLPWFIVAAGLLAMYGPTFWGLFTGIWTTEQQGHGPIVFGISIWLIWRKWSQINTRENESPKPLAAWILIGLSGLIYSFGRADGILTFEVGSLVSMIAGVVLLLRGPQQLMAVTFGLFFMLFMIPLPESIVDALTQPMKMAVSWVAEKLLFAVGYPIARSGVTLQIGPYRLLVADACAGLHTLFTLEALGLLYLNVVRSASVFRNVALAILIVPVSFSANVIRVMVLTLVTYHLGDAAGQGFLHGFAGMVLFASALLLIMALDSGLRLASSLVTRTT
jgi:exosortase B